MKNLILLIFTPEDLAFLPEAVKRLRAMAIEFLWIMHTPQLGLPYPDSAKALDAEIQSCEKDKQRASMADNFDDAAKFRDQANGLRVKRELEIKNAYKALSAAQILAVYDETFAGLTEETTGIPNIIREALPDPIAPDAALAYLGGLGTNWYDQFPQGEYAVCWVRALPESTLKATFEKAAPVGDYTTGTVITNEKVRLSRLPFFTLKKEAAEAGVETGGKQKPKIIDEILAARQLAAL
jgi:hypothetical protein